MIIYLEGSIGCGKSTLLSIIQKLVDNKYIEIIQEPVNEWKNLVDENNKNLLQYFYEDPKRWSLTFQINAFFSRINKLQQLQPNKIYIVERSVYSDKNCFAINCYQNGLINQLEWNIYNNWYQWLITKSNIQPHGFIYLQCQPNICYQRIMNRNRTEESTITLDYLQQLHNLHNDWLLHNKIPTLVLDYNQGFDSINSNLKLIIQFLENLIQNKNYNSNSSKTDYKP